MSVSISEDPGVAGNGTRVAGRSLADGIVSAIETRIREERLPAGHRIGTKQEMAEEFRVAPATLSEALRLLRARGVVEVRPGPGGGTFVTDQPPLIRLAHTVLALRDNGASANDVLGVLDALDEAVIRDAAKFRRRRDLRELDSLLKKLGSSWENPGASRTWNWRLHRRIAEITPNAILRAFYQRMVDFIESDALRASQDVPSFMSDSEERFKIHADIVEAIRSQDQLAVRDVVLRHRSN